MCLLVLDPSSSHCFDDVYAGLSGGDVDASEPIGSSGISSIIHGGLDPRAFGTFDQRQMNSVQKGEC